MLDYDVEMRLDKADHYWMIYGFDYVKCECIEYTLGYSEKGYLDMCRHCNGAETKKYLITVAE